MGKSKLANGKAGKAADPLTTVKAAGVSKASSTPVAKSKKMAKEVALKAVNGKSKKSKKVESDSESSESDSSEEEEDSDSEDSEADDASDSDDDDSDSSEEEKEKKPAPKSKTNGKATVPAPKTNGKAKAADSDSEESNSSDDDGDDSDDSDEEADAAVEKTAKAAATNGKKNDAKTESSDEDEDDDDDDSDDSDSSDDDEEEEEKKPEPSKKRKAEEEVSTPFKKTKAADASDDAPVTLFVGNLGWAVDDDKLYEAFKDCADLVSARVVTDKAMQRSRGFGYVDFANPEACQAALEKMQGFELEGRAMNLDPSKPKPADNGTPTQRANDRAQRHGDTVSQESDTIFVGNLPWDADEEVVTAFFGEVAEIKSVRLPTDRETGERKGFGYVTFNSVEEAKSVFDTKNGAYIGEGRGARAVRLDFAAQRPPREGGDFGGRGGGGGFGGRGGGGGFGGRGGGGRGGGRGGFGDRGGRGGRGGGRGGPRGGSFGSRGGGFQGKKITF